jgi:hypothetical protein
MKNHFTHYTPFQPVCQGENDIFKRNNFIKVADLSAIANCTLQNFP